MQVIKLDLTKPEIEMEISEDSEIVALYIGRNSDILKSNVLFKHIKPNITSRVNIKAVLFDNSRFDMDAKLIIEDGASNTDTYLKIDVLVIDPAAQARAVPSLEIKEDSVKGGHGATIGKPDPLQLHYLMSRGLELKSAQELIVNAFIDEIASKISN